MSSKYENSGLSQASGSALGDLFGAAVSTIGETIESGAATFTSQPHRTNGNEGAYALGVKKSLTSAFDCFRQSGPALADNDNGLAPVPYWKRDAAPGMHAA